MARGHSAKETAEAQNGHMKAREECEEMREAGSTPPCIAYWQAAQEQWTTGNALESDRKCDVSDISTTLPWQDMLVL